LSKVTKIENLTYQGRKEAGRLFEEVFTDELLVLIKRQAKGMRLISLWN
jgi:hypothetical protein